jgi:hypothetical protein
VTAAGFLSCSGRRYWGLRRTVLIVPLVVVTVTLTVADPPWSSEIVNPHVPAATAVMMNVADGPVPEAGAIVAIPAHDCGPFAAVSVPA